MGDEIMGLLFCETFVTTVWSHSSGREGLILIISLLSLGIPGDKHKYCLLNSLQWGRTHDLLSSLLELVQPLKHLQHPGGSGLA